MFPTLHSLTRFLAQSKKIEKQFLANKYRSMIKVNLNKDSECLHSSRVKRKLLKAIHMTSMTHSLRAIQLFITIFSPQRKQSLTHACLSQWQSQSYGTTEEPSQLIHSGFLCHYLTHKSNSHSIIFSAFCT